MGKVEKFAEFAKSLDFILKADDLMLETARKMIFQEIEKRYVETANKRYMEVWGNEDKQRKANYIPS